MYLIGFELRRNLTAIWRILPTSDDLAQALFHDRIPGMSQLTPDETLLGLLAAQTRHGYELQECFRDPAQLGEVWNLSTSQLYAVLKRLEQQGFGGADLGHADHGPRV